MLKQIFLLILGILFFQNSLASTPNCSFSEGFSENQKCPTFKLEFSPRRKKPIRKGENIRLYMVAEDTKNFRPVSYSWAISGGRIIKGNGTGSIILNTSESQVGHLTVTLTVEFYPVNCIYTRTVAIYISPAQSQSKVKTTQKLSGCEARKSTQKTPRQRSKRNRYRKSK